jgi:hypothetical protein
MATKSFLKNINIRDKGSARNFANALENARNVPGKKVTINKVCITVKKDKIKELFGEK